MAKVVRFKVYYLVKFYWQSYSCQSLQRLEVERVLLGFPFSMSFRLNNLRVYVLRSAHAQNKAAECLESCVWVGKSQFFCLSAITNFLESHLTYNEGTLLHKVVCSFEFNGFRCFKLFFGFLCK